MNRRSPGFCEDATKGLLAILKAFFSADDFMKSGAVDSLRISDIMRLAKVHGIEGLVTQKLLEPLDKGSKDYAMLTQAQYLAGIAALKNCAILHEIQRIAKDNRISCLFFKGAALAQMAYGRVSSRSYQDVDLIVETYEDARKLRELLEEKADYASLDKLSSCGEVFKKLYHIEFQLRSPDGIGVDIHWRLFHDYYCRYSVADLLTDGHFSLVEVCGKQVVTLPAEEHLLVLAVHHSVHCWNQLRLVADIAAMIQKRKEICYRTVYRKAEKVGAQRRLNVAMSLAEMVMGIELPDEAIKRLQNDRVAGRIARIVRLRLMAGRRFSRRDEMIFQLSVCDSWKGRLVLLGKSMTQPSDNDVRFLRLPDRLANLYYLIRPLRLVIQFLWP